MQIESRHDAGFAKGAIVWNPKVVSGAATFPGTRVFVQTLHDYLAEGRSLDEFLVDYPSVSRQMALAALKVVFEHAIGTPNESRRQCIGG